MIMLRNILITAYFIILLPNLLLPQIQISGYIYDQVDNKPLIGARVILDGTILGAITDQNGRYQISKITPGWYSIIVLLPGYRTLKETILLSKDTIINFYLQYQDIIKSEVVVTASRRMQVLSDVPVSMSVLETEYFQNKNYYELKEYMNFIPSVDVNSDNISIRGSSGYQFGSGSRVTLLLDGFPFLSGDIGEANINIFPPEIVSRVEVLKGAGSAIYGNSAMGGVVNIITKIPEEQTLLLAKASTGFYTMPKYDEWKYTNKIRTKNSLALTYLLPRNSMKLLLATQFLNDESYRNFNRSNGINFFGKFINQIGSASTFSFFTLLNYKFSDDASYWKSVQYATLPPDDYDLSRRITKRRLAFGADFLSTIGKNSFFSAKSSLFATDFESNLPKSDINYRQSTSYSNFNEFQITHHLFENSFLTTGINLINNWVHSQQYGTRKQNVLSTFTQAEFKMFNKLNATGGIRLDLDVSDSSDKYFEISPRFGITYKELEKLVLRSSVGKGFRVATISERFSSVRFSGFTIEPNPDLSPERSWNFEIGSSLEIDIFGKKSLFDFSIFYSRYNNLIEPQFDTNASTPTIRFFNISEAEIKGLDFSTNFRLSKNIDYNLSFVYLDPLDLNTKDILKFRSKFYFTSGLNLSFEKLKMSVLYKYVSKIVKVEEQLRFILRDYYVRVPVHLMDLNLSYNFQNFDIPFEVTFSIQNLLDYYYVDLVGNLAPTRFISLGVNFRIK